MLSYVDGAIKLWRYKIEYAEVDLFPADPAEEEKVLTLEEVETRITEYAASDRERDTILARHPGAQVEEIDQTDNEWIEGMEFASRDEALAALELGEEGYQNYLQEHDPICRLEAENTALMLALTELFEHVLEEA